MRCERLRTRPSAASASAAVGADVRDGDELGVVGMVANAWA